MGLKDFIELRVGEGAPELVWTCYQTSVIPLIPLTSNSQTKDYEIPRIVRNLREQKEKQNIILTDLFSYLSDRLFSWCLHTQPSCTLVTLKWSVIGIKNYSNFVQILVDNEIFEVLHEIFTGSDSDTIVDLSLFPQLLIRFRPELLSLQHCYANQL